MAYFIFLIKNYLFIQLSIIAFIALFYLVYWYKSHKFNKHELPFSEHLEYFFSSSQANYLMFVWAMLEAVVWFVIPEFLLLLIVFLRIRKKIQLLSYDILGTITGTTLSFFVPLKSRTDIINIPYIQPGMITQVEIWYQHMGLWGLLLQPFSGIPYKVFTLLASKYNFFLPVFLIVAVLVRISRYYIFYLAFSGIYPFFHKFVYRNYTRLFFISCFIFTVFLLKVYEFYGSTYLIDYSFIKKWEYIQHILK